MAVFDAIVQSAESGRTINVSKRDD
jgi:hypothetical protein